MAAKKPEESSSSSSSEEEVSEQEVEKEQAKPTQKEKSSSEEEESEEEESSSDEGEQNQAKPNPNPQIQQNGSKSESESESESDGSPSAYKLQPIPKPPTTAAKRTNEEVSENSSKSTKKPKIEQKKPVPLNTSSGYFIRLWTDDDEIILLNGLIEFNNSKGGIADLGEFYDYIKEKLQVEFSREQMRSKISRLKKKFSNDEKRGKDGSDPVFSKPHESKVFEISKKIWGNEDWKIKGCSNGKSSNGVHKETVKATKKIEADEKDGEEGVIWSKYKQKKLDEKKIKGCSNSKVSNGVHKETKEAVEETKKIEMDEEDGEERVIWSKYPFLSSSFAKIGQNFPSFWAFDALKDKLSLVGNTKAKELDGKWKKILMEETELHYKMTDLMREQVKLGLEIDEGGN